MHAMLFAAFCAIGAEAPDHTAYRFDSTVLGWNHNFTQVAAVGLEVWRSALGAHRGDASMLVYHVGDILPLRNIVITHITHVAVPDNPIALEWASKFVSDVSDNFKSFFPKLPLDAAPHGAMGIEPIWQIAHLDNGRCAPSVAFALTWHNKHKIQPFQVLDMQVDCANLRYHDTRIVWGRQDIAAALMRFDFASADHTHEHSARFLVSAAWHLGHHVNISVEQGVPIPLKYHQELLHALSHFGTVEFSVDEDEIQPQDLATDFSVSYVAVSDRYADLGRYVANILHATTVKPLEGDLFGDTAQDMVIHIGHRVLLKKDTKKPVSPQVPSNTTSPNTPDIWPFSKPTKDKPKPIYIQDFSAP